MVRHALAKENRLRCQRLNVGLGSYDGNQQFVSTALILKVCEKLPTLDMTASTPSRHDAIMSIYDLTRCKKMIVESTLQYQHSVQLNDFGKNSQKRYQL